MEVSKIIREDFLQQNAFMSYDYNCPLAKSVGMLKVIIYFYNGCLKALTDMAGEAGLTWAHIKTAMGTTIVKITRMKFEEPLQDKEVFEAKFGDLISELEAGFHAIAE